MPRAQHWFLGLILTLASQNAAAQAKPNIRNAANEVRFRVIPRFEAAPSFPPRLAALIDAKQYAQALAELTSRPLPQEHAQFLEGYLAYQAGEYRLATKVLSTHAPKLGVLEEYAWFYAAKSALEAAQPKQAALYASRVRLNPLLKSESIWMMANALKSQGETDEATRAFRGLVSSYPKSKRAREAHILLAQEYASAGRWDDAARAWMRVRDLAPISKPGRVAQASLTKNQSKFSNALQAKTKPTPATTLNAYRARFRAHQSEAIVKDLPELSKSWNKGGSAWCEAQYLVAKSYSKLRKHALSLPWYQAVVSACKAHPNIRRKALYNGGKGRWNAGKKDAAVTWFSTIWTTYPEHSYADDAMYFAARIRSEQGKAAEAEAILRQQITKYPSGDMAADAHWMLVRGYFKKANYKGVLAYLAQNNVTESDLYSRGRMAYFRARAMELGELGDARQAYQECALEAPLSYYALLALNRLRTLEGVKDLCLSRPKYCKFSTVGGPIAPVDPTIQKNPAFLRGLALIELHLGALGRREFVSIRSLAKTDEALWAVANLLDRAKAFPLSHDIPRREIKDWETAYPDPNSLRKWNIAYPRPFDAEIAVWSSKRAIPASLAYAIIREESGFSPGIESWANARGLMQLMEGTGRRMAKDDGLSNFKAADLFAAPVAVRLGTRYLWELGTRFNNNPALIIAGYNGGAKNVRTWMARDPTASLDLFVEDIPFGQTRNYTKRVLRTFWIYEYLRGRRVPSIPFTLPKAT